MNGLYTILLLVLSNIFMTLAWYGHLKLQQTGVSSNWPLIGVIAFSWAIAFFEYCCQVQGETGMRIAYRLRHHRQYPLSGTGIALESFRSLLLPDCSRLFRIHEIAG